jgi:hypothetical protein
MKKVFKATKTSLTGICLTAVIALFAVPQEGSSQTNGPGVEWVRHFGGDQEDILWRITERQNGGFVLEGTSFSDVSGTRGIPNLFGPNPLTPDLWTVCLDGLGNKVGETNSDFVPLFRTLSGDEIGNYLNWTNKMSEDLGGPDIWLVRRNAQGQKIWDRTFGGSGDDRMTWLAELPDGGFVLAATSSSPPGATKASANFGDWDYWVLRLDEQGEVLWDRTFGGSRNDFASSFHLTADGGMILGGFSESPPDGNKTSPQYSRWPYDADYWVVRLDAEGNKLWENSYGGNQFDWLSTMQATSEGGYLLGGWSSSTQSGNKTTDDIGGWVVRIDARGNKLWDRAYHPGTFTYLFQTLPTTDGGFILGGSTGIDTGSKIYVVRIDLQGNKLWEQLHNPGSPNNFAGIHQTKDGGFIIGSRSVVGRQHDYVAIKLAAEDDDGDGVPNHLDQCPATTPGQPVDGNGCSIEQRCPCEGPWRSRGDYLSCVQAAALTMTRSGQITESERRALVREASRSDCGRPGTSR